MYASRFIAPFAVAAVVAGAAPVLNTVQSPLAPLMSSAATTLTGAVSDLSFDGPWGDFEGFDGPWGDFGGFWENGHDGGPGHHDHGFGRFSIDDIVSVIESLGGGGAILSTVQAVANTVITELGNGGTWFSALTLAGQQIADTVGGDTGIAIQNGLEMIGKVVAIAPTIKAAALSVAESFSTAVPPVVEAFKTAWANVVSSLGDPAAIEAGIAGIVSAISDGVTVVKAAVGVAVHSIKDALVDEVTILPAAAVKVSAAAATEVEAAPVESGSINSVPAAGESNKAVERSSKASSPSTSGDSGSASNGDNGSTAKAGKAGSGRAGSKRAHSQVAAS